MCDVAATGAGAAGAAAFGAAGVAAGFGCGGFALATAPSVTSPRRASTPTTAPSAATMSSIIYRYDSKYST